MKTYFCKIKYDFGEEIYLQFNAKGEDDLKAQIEAYKAKLLYIKMVTGKD